MMNYLHVDSLLANDDNVQHCNNAGHLMMNQCLFVTSSSALLPIVECLMISHHWVIAGIKATTSNIRLIHVQFPDVV